MNAYNENLRSAVVTSLQSQSLEQKNLQAKQDSSMFALYHAEGATITAYEKLGTAQKDLDFKSEVQSLAVTNSNISNNELASATQASSLQKQAVSDVAVAASNIQIAANAVVKLASDIGSVYSIVNASDFDSDIYRQAEDARELMNETAYLAEVTSQLGMEASMLTSEVSSDTVLNESKSTNAAMNNILKIAENEFNTASQTVATDNAAVSSTSAKEKVAEGNFKYLSVEANASSDAYNSINNELNLGLTVNNITETSFEVDFKSVKNPFGSIPEGTKNPVSKYYLFVVKESKSSLFSISTAENIIIKESNNEQFIEIEASNKAKITETVNFLNVNDNGKALKDTDGKDIDLGLDYVVFVMAVYTDTYKRTINNFSDFLSAASPSFAITQQIQAVNSRTIKVAAVEQNKLKDDEITVLEKFNNALVALNVNIVTPNKTDSDVNFKISFTAPGQPSDVEYRCMLLPVSETLPKGMLTAESMDNFYDEITSMEAIAKQFDPDIEEIQSRIYQTELKLKDTAEAKEVKNIKTAITSLTEELNKKQKSKDSAIKKLTGLVQKKKIGFYFNLELAEQVPVGSFLPAVKASEKTNGDTTEVTMVAYIKPGTTDNFGNMLINGDEYMPVILAVSTATEENQSKFTNALSSVNARAFEYKEN